MAPALSDNSYAGYSQPEPAVISGKPAACHASGLTVTSYDGQYTPSPSRLVAECHPLEKEIAAEVDGFFLEHWPFKTEKERKKIVDAGFSRVTCLYFPKALDDRIGFASRLLTILFLIDDLLEDISLEEGAAYNEKLIPIARGDVLPDRAVPVEWIMYDLWEDMRAHDKALADDILKPTFTFMRAQRDKARLSTFSLKDYLVYRERDVGKAQVR